MHSFKFPKAEHLKSRKDIERLFTSGESFFVSPYKVVFQITQGTNCADALQVGFAVSSKSFKKAVDRNRIKRLGREAYRLHKHVLLENLKMSNQCLQAFFIFTGKKLPNFTWIEKKMQSCFSILILKCNEKLL